MPSMNDSSTNIDEYLTLIASLESKLTELDDLRSTIVDSGMVSRTSMESLEAIVPDCIDDAYPINSFTKDASDQNLEVSLESIDKAKAVIIAVAGAVLVAIIAALSHIFQNQSPATMGNEVKKHVDETISQVKGMVKVEDPSNLRAVEASKIMSSGFNWRMFENELGIDTLKPETSASRLLVQWLLPNSPVLRTIGEQSKRLNKIVSSLNSRIQTIVNITNAINSNKLSNPNKAYQELSHVISESDSGIIDSITKIYDDLLSQCNVSDLNGLKPIIGNHVIGSESYYDTLFVLTERELKQIDQTFPHTEAGVKKSIGNVEKAVRKLNTTNIKDAINEVVKETDISVTNNDMARKISERLESALESIRTEVIALRRYDMLVRLVGHYYKVALGKNAKEAIAIMNRIIVEENGRAK